MKKKFFLIWIFLFAVLIAFDVLVYRGAEELECIEPSIGTTAVINIVLSMISAVIFVLLFDSYSLNKKTCWIIFIAQFISLVSVFVWLLYLNIIPLILISIIILAIAIVEIINKNIRLAVACFFWRIVLFGLISYIPGMGYWSVWQ